MTTPWWYSGDDAERAQPEGAKRAAHESDPSAEQPADSSSARWDPAGLVAAANQLVEWATERFVEPHAEHTNPADHPSCVLCRGTAVLGTMTRPKTSSTVEPITWIPVRRSQD